MFDITSLDAAAFALGLLAPGFIVTYVRTRFLTGRMASGPNLALQYVTLTAIYYALVFPFLQVVRDAHQTDYLAVLAWFGLIFVGPALFGFVLGIEAQINITRRLVRWIGLNPVHGIPSAWDWKFSSTMEQWVIVSLKDGTQFAGLCGTKSFASSDAGERDLYIEQVFELDTEKKWIEQKGKSVLITAGQITTIEFWNYRT